MKNFFLFFLIFIFIKCNSQDISLIGNWSYIEKNGNYKELYIDNKSITVIDNTGAQANMLPYKFDNNQLIFPYFKYFVKFIDNSHAIWYNNKDTVYPERIPIKNIKDQSLSSFMLRKYNYLVSHNYISGDSAINSLLKFKKLKQNEETNIPEYEIIYQDSIILKPINK